MSLFRLKSDAGVIPAALVIGIASVVVGGAASVGAVVAVVSTYGPADDAAVKEGPKDVLLPDQILTYNG